jgi:hypothetical protein
LPTFRDTVVFRNVGHLSAKHRGITSHRTITSPKLLRKPDNSQVEALLPLHKSQKAVPVLSQKAVPVLCQKTVPALCQKTVPALCQKIVPVLCQKIVPILCQKILVQPLTPLRFILISQHLRLRLSSPLHATTPSHPIPIIFGSQYKPWTCNAIISSLLFLHFTHAQTSSSAPHSRAPST